MYPTGIILFVLACLGSLLGCVFIATYLGASPSDDHSLAYVVGLIVTVPSLALGACAAVLFFVLRGHARFRSRALMRGFWLPVSPPALAILGLHLMLLREPSDPNPCPASLPNTGDECHYGVKGCTYADRVLQGTASHTFEGSTATCWCEEGRNRCRSLVR